MPQALRRWWLEGLLLAVLVGTATILLLKPIYDNDFFWHLKTGQWIWQHGRLPVHDPFNFTNPATPTPAMRFTLTAYWLSQLVLYLAHQAAGMAGIVGCRFLLAGALLLTLWRRLAGTAAVRLSLLLLFAVLILNFYYLERPQAVSFLGFALLLLQLERLRAAADNPAIAAWRLLWPPAVTMLLWANAHGGFLIGQVTLLLVAATEGVKFLSPRLKPLSPAGYGRLVTVAGLALAASLLNPNHLQALLLMLHSAAGDPSTQVQEYVSLLEFYRASRPPVVLLYLALMGVSGALLLWRWRRLELAEALLLLGIGAFSLLHVRYAGFFPIVALPLLARELAGGALGRWLRRLLPPLAIAVALLAAGREAGGNLAAAGSGAWVSARRFPVRAADFLAQQPLRGKLYNPYDWGGYLIWRLAPAWRVFADGRNLNAAILAEEYQIASARVNYLTGEKVWKRLLQRYDVDCLLTRSRDRAGQLTPLANALLADRDWAPVFVDAASHAVIFVRRRSENAALLRSATVTGL